MDPFVALWLLALGGLALGGLATWHFAVKTNARRRLRATAISRIGDVRQRAVVRVVGRVVGVVGDPLAAPATGRPCAYWRFEIREDESGDSSGVTRFSATAACDFWLEDESGRALVHAGARTTWVVVQDLHGRSGTFDGPTPEEDALFRRYGIDPHHGFFRSNKVLTYRQESVDVGEIVTVLGLAHREIDTAVVGSGYREAGTRLVIVPENDRPIIVSDEPGLLRDSPA